MREEIFQIEELKRSNLRQNWYFTKEIEEQEKKDVKMKKKEPKWKYFFRNM